MRSQLVAVSLSLPALLLTAACGAEERLGEISPIEITRVPKGAASVVVAMSDAREFVPPLITVDEGDIVEWRNTSTLTHSVTAEPSMANEPEHVRVPEGADVFYSANIPPGGSYRHLFEAPGLYEYVCIPHEMQGMRGQVVVRPEGR